MSLQTEVLLSACKGGYGGSNVLSLTDINEVRERRRVKSRCGERKERKEGTRWKGEEISRTRKEMSTISRV